MNSSTKLTSLVLTAALAGGVAGGIAGGLAGSVLQRPASPARGPSTEALRPAQAPDDAAQEELSARLDEFALQNATLRARLAALEDELDLAQARVPVAIAPEQVVARLARETGDVSASTDPAFLARVDEALTQIRSEEQREAQQRWRELQIEKVTSRVARLVEPLGLSVYQQDELQQLLSDRELRRAEINTLGKEHGDKDVTRESLRELRQKTAERLAAVLTPEQLADYETREGERDAQRFGGETEKSRKDRDDQRSTKRKRSRAAE